MGIFDNMSEKQRKESLALLEDKRVAFAKKLAGMGLAPGRALYVQCGGGFHGVVLSSCGILYLTGPGPMEQEDDFTVSVHRGVELVGYDEDHSRRVLLAHSDFFRLELLRQNERVFSVRAQDAWCRQKSCCGAADGRSSGEHMASGNRLGMVLYPSEPASRRR